MRFELKFGFLAIAAFALVGLAVAPASAQWRYYNGYQSNPPPYPGGGQPYGYGYGYQEPQSAPPNQGNYANAPSNQGYSNQPPSRPNTESYYNAPPDDAAAAASQR